MKTLPSRYRTLLAITAVALLISFAGCSAPGPMGKPAGGGERSGLSPSPVFSWDSKTAVQIGRVQVDFELAARVRAAILPAPDPDKILLAPRPTEP